MSLEPIQPKRTPTLLAEPSLPEPVSPVCIKFLDDNDVPDPPQAPAVAAGGGNRRFRMPWPLLFVAGVVSVSAAFLFGGPPFASVEQGSANWNRVQRANEAYEADHANPVCWFDGQGVENHGSQILVSHADFDAPTSQVVASALRAGDLTTVVKVIREAQAVPEPNEPVTTLKPTLSDGLNPDLLRQGTDFYHIYLYDSCDEDGDIVEILLDGVTFAAVPLTHRGATLSVPVSRTQPTQISVRGVRDGGGGITVACRTSQGDFFSRTMAEGEVQSLAIAVK
jgi:hypothetical protein